MSVSIGKNTIQAKRLREIVEASEQYDQEKKDISDLNSALMAAAKAEGFNPKAISLLKKRRKMKPHDRQEADELFHMYEFAMGMDEEPPLFRQLSAMAEDSLSREALLESFKQLAPTEGDIILRIGSEPVRIYRDHTGTPQVEPYEEKKAARTDRPAASPLKGRLARDVPEVDEDGAEEHGRQMYRDNKPITENPFPYGDPRRARCDEGYRLESGGDGMGDD